MSRAISHIDTFQGLILAYKLLGEQGTYVLQPYDMEWVQGHSTLQLSLRT